MSKIWNYCKSHKLKSAYIFYVCMAVIIGTRIEDSFEIQIFDFYGQIPPVVIAVLILVATTISLLAICRFDKERLTIETEAECVAINETAIVGIKRLMDRITLVPVKLAMILPACLSFFMVSIASNGFWKIGTCVYAIVLVGGLIWATLYAYIYFFVIILCMKAVYECSFRRYIYIYPLATSIFAEFNGICTYGLVCFWAIGMILGVLSLIVFNADSLGLLLIIGLLILLGYIVFTFYPYYLTRKKVFMLKLQTISTICVARNMMIKKNYDDYIPIIKSVSESPNVLTTNFNMVLTSTLTAIASLLTSIFMLWG